MQYLHLTFFSVPLPTFWPVREHELNKTIITNPEKEQWKHYRQLQQVIQSEWFIVKLEIYAPFQMTKWSSSKVQKCLPNLEERVFICYIINKNCTIAANQWDNNNYTSFDLSLSEAVHTSDHSNSTQSPFIKETTRPLLEWEHCQHTPHEFKKTTKKTPATVHTFFEYFALS